VTCGEDGGAAAPDEGNWGSFFEFAVGEEEIWIRDSISLGFAS